MKYYEYDLIDYDVWGNKRNGFEVNNAWVEESGICIAESELETDKKTIQSLKKLGIIKSGIHTSSIEIDGENEYTLYFNDVRQEAGGFRPAFELRCTKVY